MQSLFPSLEKIGDLICVYADGLFKVQESFEQNCICSQLKWAQHPRVNWFKMSRPARCTRNNVTFISFIFIERIGQDCRCDLGLRVFCPHVSLTPLMPGLPLLSGPSCLYLPFPSSSDVRPHSMGCTEGAEDNRKQPPSRAVFDICPATYLFGLTFKLWPYSTNHLQRLPPCHLCNNTAYNSI